MFGSPVERTREFNPTDRIARSEAEVLERLEELKANKEKFDPETQFTGLRRIGSKCTVAEPLAYFDWPRPDKEVGTRQLMQIIVGFSGFITSVALFRLKKATYLTGLSTGVLLSIPTGYIGGLAFDVKRKYMKDKRAMLLHYAILNENNFPLIRKFKFEFWCYNSYFTFFPERKRFGEILKDWPTQRSLNVLGKNKEYTKQMHEREAARKASLPWESFFTIWKNQSIYIIKSVQIKFLSFENV